MTPESYERARAIYVELRGAEPTTWDARLVALTDDDEIRRTVRELLEIDARNRDFLETPAAHAFAARPSMTRSIPERIGAYRILRVAGEGGMGIVYEAEQDEPRRIVALKVLRLNVRTEELIRRFRNEAQMLARLRHPGIAQVYDAGTVDLGDGMQPFFAMEFIDGRPLLVHAREGGLSTRARLALVARICEAIHHANVNGVVHRDLKPANIVVNEHGVPKVLDFGVARATRSDVQLTTVDTVAGQLLGTVPYMSPEQIAGVGDGVDARSDVYALGVLTYELLTGKHPLEVANLPLIDAARRIADDDPTQLGAIDTAFRGDVDTIVAKALEKEPDRRYATARELGEEIRRFLDGQPIHARPASTWYQVRKFTQRNRGLVTAIAVIMAVLAVGLVSTTLFALRSGRNAEVAAAKEAESERNLYLASIGAARSALMARDPASAHREMDRAPVAHRHWEWHHLQRQLDVIVTERVLDVRGGTDRAAFTARGAAHGVTVQEDELRIIDLVSGATVRSLGSAAGLSVFGLAEDASAAAALRGDDALLVWLLGEAGPPRVVPIRSEAWKAYRASEPPAIPGPVRPDLRVDSRGERLVLLWPTPEGGSGVLFDGSGEVALMAGHAAFASDGKLLTASGPLDAPGEGVTIELRNVTGDVMPRYVDLGTQAIAVSPDGRLVAAGTMHHARHVHVLDGTTLEEIEVLRGHTSAILALAFTPDGQRVASLGWDAMLMHDVRGGPVGHRVAWPRSNPLEIAGFDPHAVPSLRISPGGQSALLTDGAVRVRLLHLGDTLSMTLRGHPTFVYGAAWSPDGELLTTVDFDRNRMVWDGLTGALLARWPAPDQSTIHSHSAIRCDVSADGRFINTHGSAQRIDLATGIRSNPDDWTFDGLPPTPGGSAAVYAGRGGVFAVRSPSGRHLAELRDGVVRVIDREMDRETKYVVPDRPRAAAFDPDGVHLATGDDAGRLQVRQLATGNVVADIADAHGSTIYTITYSPDGARLVTAGNDNVIRIWDGETYELVTELPGHETYVHCVAFSPGGRRLASASGDHTVRLWDATPRAELRARIAAAADRRRAIRPRIESMLVELGDAAKVADAIWADAALTEGQRTAALRVLLEQSPAAVRPE